MVWQCLSVLFHVSFVCARFILAVLAAETFQLPRDGVIISFALFRIGWKLSLQEICLFLLAFSPCIAPTYYHAGFQLEERDCDHG